MIGNKTYIRDVMFLNEPSVFARMYSLMPVYRRNKIDSFRMEKDRKLSLLAGILLMEALENEGLSERIGEMAFNDFGKPFIPDCPVRFNISHSENKVLLSVSSGEVGCDIERIKAIDSGLAKRFFTDDEYRSIMDKGEGYERILEFYRIWTLKESYTKALGRGLDIPLNSFSVYIEDGKPRGPEGCEFEQFVTDDGYCCSICRII